MAAIVQKTSATTTTTTSTLFFGCGDIFNLNNTSEKAAHNEHITKHSTVVENESALEKMDLKDNFEKPNENGNNCHYQRFHNALTRTISQPQPPMLQQGSSMVSTLVTPLIEDFGNINLHRKLERTQSEPLPQQLNTSRYKTELCRPFEEAGECKYGEKCQFAHGYHELRNLQRHPKYKTEYCRTFHSVGFCPYGPRCHFVHNADEVRSSQQQLPPPPQQQQQQQQQQQPPPPPLHHNKLPIQQNSHQTAPNNFNNCLSTYGLTSVVGVGSVVAAGQQQNINALTLGLPLSPPLSMSTGSDRESPTGSLSLSPANSMTNFPFCDQIINHAGNNVFQTNNNNYVPSSYVNTPPESPNAPISPVNTPPPQAQLQYIKPAATNVQGKLILQKSSSSPIAIAANKNVSVGIIVGGGNKTLNKMNSSSSLNGDGETRLPVFNRLSSTIENIPNMAL